MAKSNAQQSQVQVSTTHPLSTGGILQRQCDTCGKHTIAGETCSACERAEGTVQQSMESIGQGGGGEEIKPEAGLRHDFSGVPIRRKQNRLETGNRVLGPPPPLFLSNPSGPAETAAKAGTTIKSPSTKNIGESLSNTQHTAVRKAISGNAKQLHRGNIHARIHTGVDVDSAAAAIDARAFTVGRDIAIGSSGRGDNALLRHETKHVQQTRLNQVPSNLVMREALQNQSVDPIANPPKAKVVYSLFGATMVPAAQSSRYMPGILVEQQSIAMYIKHLVGNQFSLQLVSGVNAVLKKVGKSFSSPVSPDPPIRAVPIRRIFFHPDVVFVILNYLHQTLLSANTSTIGNFLNITREQVRTLELGKTASIAFNLMQTEAFQKQLVGFPRWYDRTLFLSHIAGFEQGLQKVNQDFSLLRQQKKRESDQDVIGSVNNLVAEMAPAADVLDTLRQFSPLWDNPGFRSFWGLDSLKKGEKANGPATSQRPDRQRSLSFLIWAPTQVKLFQKVWETPSTDKTVGVKDPRQQLWERFARRDSSPQSAVGELKDQVLRNLKGNDRNTPPFPSTVAHQPELKAPFFESSMDSTHIFVMSVKFSDVFDHLAHIYGGFRYGWELFKVETAPEPTVNQSGNAKKQLDASIKHAMDAKEKADDIGEKAKAGSGYSPKRSDLQTHRKREIARDYLEDYGTAFGNEPNGAATISNQISSLTAALGSPGYGPASIEGAFNASKAIDALGKALAHFFYDVTKPQNETKMPVGKQGIGLYVVRAYCDPILKDDSEVRRATSVAWTPIWVRPPEALAQLTLTRDLLARSVQTEQLGRIQEELAQQKESNLYYERLSAEHTALFANLHGDAGQVLEAQIQQLETLKLSAGTTDKQRKNIDKQIANFKKIKGIRDDREKERGVGSKKGAKRAERLRARFVPDASGQAIQPLVEVVEIANQPSFSYRAYDVSLPTGNIGKGTGSTRQEAIKNALKALYEQYDSYGKGYLSVFIPFTTGDGAGSIETIRILRDKTAIGMEAIDNITMVVSMAAMAAAPFTGSASIAIMLPVGLIGAVPATYRLADRYQAGVLDLYDIQTALDLIDVVGATFGPVGSYVSKATKPGSYVSKATKLRSLGYFGGQGLMVIGVGSDYAGVALINYHLVNEVKRIKADPNKSDGEKRAEILLLFGQALQANGMAAGGKLIEMSQSGLHKSGKAHLPNSDVPNSSKIADATNAPKQRVLSKAPELQAALPKDLQLDISVQRASDLGNYAVHVEYTRGAFGLVTDVAIRAGAKANAIDIKNHVDTVRAIQRYMGIIGGIRLLLTKFEGFRRLYGEPPFGSLAYEAMLEVRKLPQIIDQKMVELQKAVEENRSTDAADFEIQIKSLKEQEAYYQNVYDRMIRTDGRGYVANEDSNNWDPSSWDQQKKDEALQSWKQDFSIPEDIPYETMTGEAKELAPRKLADAIDLEIPPESSKYFWGITRGRELKLFEPRKRKEKADGSNYPDTRRQVRGSTVDAVAEGYPLPPANHSYYKLSDGTFQLQRIKGYKGDLLQVESRQRTNDSTSEDFGGNEGFKFVSYGKEPVIEPKYHKDTSGENVEQKIDLDTDSGINQSQFKDLRKIFDDLVTTRDKALIESVRTKKTLIEIRGKPPQKDTPEHEVWKKTPERIAHKEAFLRIGQQSEKMTEYAADLYVQSRYPSAERIFPDPSIPFEDVKVGKGTFDVVYKYIENGIDKYIVVEAKGGGSTLGSRKIEGKRFRQGTPQYFSDVALAMEKTKNDAKMRALGRTLGSEETKNIKYLHIQLPLEKVVKIDSSGQSISTKVGSLKVREFDLGNSNN